MFALHYEDYDIYSGNVFEVKRRIHMGNIVSIDQI